MSSAELTLPSNTSARANDHVQFAFRNINQRIDDAKTAAHAYHSQSERAAQIRFEMLLLVLLSVYRDMVQKLVLLGAALLSGFVMLHRSITQMPRQMLTHASTIFEDAHGYVFYINTQFIQSWRVSVSVLS